MELTIDQALQRGIVAHKAGKIVEADQMYTAILKSNPYHPDANHNMGVLAVGIGKVADALPFFISAIESNPSIEQFWLSYVDALDKLDQISDAVRLIDKILKSNYTNNEIQAVIEKIQNSISEKLESKKSTQQGNASSIDYWKEKAITYRENGDYDSAITLLCEYLENNPAEPYIHSLIANCYILKGDLQNAEAHLGEAKKLNSNLPDINLQQSRLFLKQEKTQRAVTLLAKTLERHPDNLECMMLYGVALRLVGHTDKSLEHLNKVLEVNNSNAEALFNRGMIFFQRKNSEQALIDLEKAYRINPTLREAWDILVTLTVFKRDNYTAIQLLQEMIERDPDHENSFRLLIAIIQKENDHHLGIRSFQKALAIRPNHPEINLNLGLALQNVGEFAKSTYHFERAVTLKPNSAIAHFHLGNAFKKVGEFQKSLQSYQEAIKIKPNHAEAFNNMGNLLHDHGDADSALVAFTQAIEINPDYAEAHNNLGILLQEKDDFESSLSAFERAVSIKSDFLAAWLNGAEILEKWNKLDGLQQWLDKAIDILSVVPADLMFMKSKLLWRKKNYEQARSIIHNIKLDSITPNRQEDYLRYKAKCFEHYNDFSSAYNCHNEANILVKNSEEYANSNGESYFENIRSALKALKTDQQICPKLLQFEKSDFTPTFLVGFPRSGTTLLDSILRTHSQIDVAEEKPVLFIAEKFLKSIDYNRIKDDEQLAEALIAARNIYEIEFKKYTSNSVSTDTFIDKLPLNILKAGLIHQLYPEAKFILAVRHPLDTILSCWMQKFELNAAMSNMVELNRIVDFYCVAMETFNICRDIFNLNVHEIRYEDLIDNLQYEVGSLLQFLNLNWEPELENYHQTASLRGRIATPSYTQVVEPIYKNARYRWVNYEDYLSEFKEKVSPWISQYKYDHL